jgi:hypothetical protein
VFRPGGLLVVSHAYPRRGCGSAAPTHPVARARRCAERAGVQAKRCVSNGNVPGVAPERPRRTRRRAAGRLGSALPLAHTVAAAG